MIHEISKNDNVLVQPLTCSLHQLISNTMTEVDSKKSKMSIHTKQCSNSLNKDNTKIKKLTNNTSDSRMCVTLCNHLNIPEVINETDWSGTYLFKWEANRHAEEGTQTAKEMFVSQRGNFGEAMFMKICMKKTLQNMRKPYGNETGNKNRFTN